jgi:hypothetical protein
MSAHVSRKRTVLTARWVLDSINWEKPLSPDCPLHHIALEVTPPQPILRQFTSEVQLGTPLHAL